MTSSPHGRVYILIPDPSTTLGGRVAATVVPLPRLDTTGEGKGRLSGRYVRVRNVGEIYKADQAYGTRIVAIGDAVPDAEGNFAFEPGRGGGRLDKVPASAMSAEYLESGIPFSEPEFRWRYIQAAHFGEVNSYFHLDLMASYVDGLLREMGSAPLPRVTAIVNAHHAVTERNGVRNGLRRGDRWLPFQGGHYRLPSRNYDLPEPEPISPSGEIHLGTGRNLVQYGALVEAAGGPYRANASHNGGILYHEYGHHITRHTADFRANALRSPNRQDNRKPAIDEGTCDYWAAAMLGTPHIWAWHLRHDNEVIHPRSLSSGKTMAQYDVSPKADAHANGTIWGAALWDMRTRLSLTGPEGARHADLIVLQALLLLGRLVDRSDEPSVRGSRALRRSFATGAAAILQANEILNSGKYKDIILSSFSKRGIQPMEYTEWQRTIESRPQVATA
jgi:hypothetical protein